MDVWVFLASRGEKNGINQLIPQLIEVFAFEPSLEDQKRALRDFLDRKLSATQDYEPDEKGLRDEDLQRMVYAWSEKNFRVFCKSLRGPDEWKTADGYTFKRQGDGTYTDGDLKFNDVVSLIVQDRLTGPGEG